MADFKKQAGVFTVELALVTVIILSFITFTSELILRQSIHGLLQNLSFSGVSLVKERTQLYDSNGAVTQDQVNDLFKLLSQSMSRSFSGFDQASFGITLEQITFLNRDIKKPVLALHKKGMHCPSGRKRLVHESQLFFLSERGNPMPLYRLNLCYRKGGSSFLSDLAGSPKLSSSALMIGR